MKCLNLERLNCESCNCEVTIPNTVVRDHCHITGTYILLLRN